MMQKSTATFLMGRLSSIVKQTGSPASSTQRPHCPTRSLNGISVLSLVPFHRCRSKSQVLRTVSNPLLTYHMAIPFTFLAYTRQRLYYHYSTSILTVCLYKNEENGSRIHSHRLSRHFSWARRETGLVFPRTVVKNCCMGIPGIIPEYNHSF